MHFVIEKVSVFLDSQSCYGGSSHIFGNINAIRHGILNEWCGLAGGIKMLEACIFLVPSA